MLSGGVGSHRARAVVCEQWGADATLIPISTFQVGHRGSVGKAVWPWKDCPDQNKSLGVGGGRGGVQKPIRAQQDLGLSPGFISSCVTLIIKLTLG